MHRRIPEETVQEIISRNDIVEVISEYLPLKPGGANHSAFCPFHNEKTPSFMVSREKQLFKCFGCGKGGDVISFVMEKENLDFVDALHKLAERVHLTIPEEDLTPEARDQLALKHELEELHRDAAAFYFSNLKHKGNPGIAYLAKRGWGIQTIKNFGLGYALNQWDSLIRHLRQKGYADEKLIKSGLVIQYKESRKMYDRFRNRVMFPIFDLRGRVVAFGGRSLDPDGTPKYLNSPETPTFNKRHILYGLNIARTHLIQQTLILVEGYTDVITLHEKGFQNAVASLGTSITSDHAELVKKTARRVILCFDGDDAGVMAAQKSIRLFHQTGLEVRILALPSETDPDQYIREYGSEAFSKLLLEAPTAIDYQISLIRRKHSLATVEGKVHFAKETAGILNQIKGLVEREAYVSKIAEEIGVSKNSLMQEIAGSTKHKSGDGQWQRSGKRENRKMAIEAMTPIQSDATHEMEMQLLNSLFIHPKSIETIKTKINEEMFQDPAHRMIYRIMTENSLLLEKEGKQDLFAGFEEEMSKIMSAGNHIEIQDNMITQFIRAAEINQLQQELKHLENRIHTLRQKVTVNPKEKEDEMLRLGTEIRRINIALQELSYRKGGKTNG